MCVCVCVCVLRRWPPPPPPLLLLLLLRLLRRLLPLLPLLRLLRLLLLPLVQEVLEVGMVAKDCLILWGRLPDMLARVQAADAGLVPELDRWRIAMSASSAGTHRGEQACGSIQPHLNRSG